MSDWGKRTTPYPLDEVEAMASVLRVLNQFDVSVELGRRWHGVLRERRDAGA